MISITLVLVVLGVIGALIINTERLSDYLKSDVLVSVYFTPGAPADRVAESVEEIQAFPFVRSSTFISKEAAAQQFKKELGTDFVEALGENPLPPSLDVYLVPEANEKMSSDSIKRWISNVEYVADIDYRADRLEQIDKFRNRIAIILGIIAIVLTLICIVLINNIVRLGVYAKRFLIKSMQLVGATQWFIIRPFVKTAFLVAIGGWLLSVLMLGGVYFGLAHWLDSELGLSAAANQSLLDTIPLYSRYALVDISEYSILFVSLLVISILLLTLSTYISTKKYLRLKIDDLY